MALDSELILKAKKGDIAAIELLWTRYKHSVMAICRRYMDGPNRDPATDAHDLSNETFIQLLHSLNSFEDRKPGGGGFEVWLMEIARRACLKSLTRHQRRRQWLTSVPAEDWNEIEDPYVNITRFAEDRDTLAFAAQEINRLSDTYRIPFKLCLEEYSNKQIAAALGITENTVMQRVHRARRRLQSGLAQRMGLTSETDSLAMKQAILVERRLSEIVSDSRIVSVTLPHGGELQICLRVERCPAAREQNLTERRSLLNAHPRAWKQRLDFANICYNSGRWDEARENYRIVLSIRPNSDDASFQLGHILRMENRMAEAVEVYQASLAHPHSTEIEARLLAERAMAEADDTLAASLFQKAIELAPLTRANYYGLHEALGRLSRYVEQLDNLAALRKIAPDDVFAYESAYTPCARLQRWDIAYSLLKHANNLAPNHPISLKHLFQVRMNLGLWDQETLELAERLVRLAPDFVDSWAELAWIYAALGRPDESIAILQKFLEDHPRNPDAHAAIAWRCHYLGRYEECARHAQQAYGLAPQNWYICWTMLVACQYAISAMTHYQAQEIAAEIASRFRQDAFIIEQLSNLYRSWGREEEALEYAGQLQVLHPDSIAANLALPHLHMHFQNWKQAEQEYRRVLLLPNGRTLEVLISLAMALMRMKDPGAAGFMAEATLLVETPEEHLIVAENYVANEQVVPAIAALTEVLDDSRASPRLRARASELMERVTVLMNLSQK